MAMRSIGRFTTARKVRYRSFYGPIFIFTFFVLINILCACRKEGEVALKVCSTNWSDQWSNFVCQSLGFTEMKTANFRPSEPTENATTYLKLKDDSSPNNFKSLTGSLELSTAPCDTVEIKCSIKHRKTDFKFFFFSYLADSM